MLNDVQSVLKTFFASYREAFRGSDVKAVLGHFAERVHVASDTGDGVHVESFTHKEFQEIVEQLVTEYRALDVDQIELRDLEIHSVSPRLSQARIQWELRDSGGATV